MSYNVRTMAERGRTGWLKQPSRRLAILTALTIVAPQVAAAASPSRSWESPFQAGRPDAVRDHLQILPASRCDGDPYNKCTFSTRVDYDGNGVLDTVRMMNGKNVGALVVTFAGKPARRALTIASFKERWAGHCYIEAARHDRRAVVLTCPEASAAVFKMRNGKPAVQWKQD